MSTCAHIILELDLHIYVMAAEMRYALSSKHRQTPGKYKNETTFAGAKYEYNIRVC